MAQALEQDLERVVERSGAIWNALAGTDIFLTGGTGFVGSWLLESFVWANKRLDLRARICVLTRDRERFRREKPHLAREESVWLWQGDWQTLRLPAHEFPYWIHAAAEVGATQRVLQMAKERGARRLLFTSSGAMYGEQPATIENLEEGFTAPIENCTPYGRAKREAEACCLGAVNEGLGVVIGRLFTFVGPYLPLDKNFAVGNFVRDARQGGPVCIEGDGTARRSYLYAGDLAAWLWTLLVRGRAGRIYNVGSDRAISIFDLARTVERVCGVKRGIRIAQQPVAGVAAQRYVPSIARAREELGLEVWTGLAEGIGRMFNFP